MRWNIDRRIPVIHPFRYGVKYGEALVRDTTIGELVKEEASVVAKQSVFT